MASFMAAHMNAVRSTPAMKCAGCKAPAFGPAVQAAPVQRGAAQLCRARVANVEIPNQKCIRYSLQYVYGVGDTTAVKILSNIGLDETKRTHALSEDELTQIRDELENYAVEGDLRRAMRLNIKRLTDINCYRGQRHYNSLPCRGQNTKNNARTKKGKKGMAIAGKKK